MTLTSLARFPGFLVWYVYQVLHSSGSVLSNILTRELRHPLRVVQIPLASTRDWQVAIFGGLITLTPGTLTLGVVQEAGERYLLVHSMQHASNEQARDELADMEARMLRAFPGRGDRT
ncbi:Na+/H+ antiporter subunit E [Ornithinimicrobium pratense]|uniref:Na+/H+ antiporter subunit E n=1 Tax=Ornithinimicrobium pratense TaxID=2593973 RepID=A0A5J6V1R9_9MICO|nr:Na+/H+ antiporter subunit E [Ornithinimicrobium pratense]QFG67575.1 Na+/H+ antiporter subunit E [Ornithinimicrobium pratense]